MESEGYTLITPEEQFTSKSRLEYICPMGHNHGIMNYSIFVHQKRRCPLCRKLQSMTPYSIIYKTFTDIKCEILYPLENEYHEFKIKSEKIQYICPNGHKTSALWHNFNKKGCTCIDCFKLRKRISYEDILKSFNERGYKVISPSKEYYKAAYKQKIRYVCPNNHEHEIMYQDFINNHGCPECAGLLNTNMIM